MALRGHLDAITSSGFAEGWAFDDQAPLSPVTIAITHADREVARAIAHNYRADLAESGCGTGWCAFRARLTVPVQELRNLSLALVECHSGQSIQEARELRFYEDKDEELSAIGDIIRNDPTLLGPLDRLKGCAGIFLTYIKERGVDDFVRAAFVFILSRPGDADGVKSYGNLIRQGLLEPLNLLHILADSDEFRSTARMLAAPGTAGFPFRLR